MEVSLDLERTIAGNSKKPMMPRRRVFRVGSRIWRVVLGTGSNANPNKIKLTPEREKYYRIKIEMKPKHGDYKEADNIRYNRHCEETKESLERKEGMLSVKI